MNYLQFGLKFLDPYLEDLPDKGVYLFSETNTNIRFSFFYHILRYHLRLGKSCLYLTSFSLAEKNDIVKKKVMALNDYENLTILETPSYLRQLIHNPTDLYKVVNDLKIYIEALSPSLILIENIELLLSENNVSLDSNLFSLIVEFTTKRKTTVIIDTSTLNDKNKMILQNFANAIFKVADIRKNENFQLILEKGKNQRDKLNIGFTHDAEYDIIPPVARNTDFYSLNECKQLIIPKDSHIYENMFSEIFKHKIAIDYYQTVEELKELWIDRKYSIIFIPAYTETINGWQALTNIRRLFPFVKIILTGSIHTPAYQKIRAIKMGADRFIHYPYNKEKMTELLKEMYQYEEKDFLRFSQHKILYVSDGLLKNYASLTIINDSLQRFLKEYAYNILSEGLSMNLFKLYMYHDISEILDDFIKISPKLLFASTYFIEEKPAILLIYNNLSEHEIKYIRNNVEHYLREIYSSGYDLSIFDDNQNTDKKVTKAQNNAFIKIIKTLDYPIDEADIDFVFDWIYSYV